MITPRRIAAFALTFSLGVGLASLFVSVKNGGRGPVQAGDYELTGKVIKHSPDPLRAGDGVTFTYEVKNAGRSAIPARAYEVEFYVDGRLVSFDRAASEIAPGGRSIYSKVEGSRHVEGITPGVHHFRLVLDPQERLAERDETNKVIDGEIAEAQ